eukprot:c1950_g1_i1 orf=72-281(+)
MHCPSPFEPDVTCQLVGAVGDEGQLAPKYIISSFRYFPLLVEKGPLCPELLQKGDTADLAKCSQGQGVP